MRSTRRRPHGPALAAAREARRHAAATATRRADVSARRGGPLPKIGLLALLALAGWAVIPATPVAHGAAWFAAVLLAAAGSLLATVAAERDRDHGSARWHAQAFAAALAALALMAGPEGAAPPEGLTLLLLGASAAALSLEGVAAMLEVGRRELAVYLAIDAIIVGSTIALVGVALGGSRSGDGLRASVLLGLFAAGAFSLLLPLQRSARREPFGPDAAALLGAALYGIHAAGLMAPTLSLGPLGAAGSPGLALLAMLAVCWSAWEGARRPNTPASAQIPANSRMRVLPAALAAGGIMVLSASEITGDTGRMGFFAAIGLFTLIIGRLVLTLRENHLLAGRVERSGEFEERLREFAMALLTTVDRSSALDLACRAARVAVDADAVVLWMVDPTTEELEVAAVDSPKARSLLHRRVGLDDPTSLAAHVAQKGTPQLAMNVASASSGRETNRFLDVVLRTQALIAVPIVHANAVQGVLVCVDARYPNRYSQQDVAKTEILASQVAVALDNVHQHELQRRRVEELAALYQFAQSAHTALASTDVARQLLPILKRHLRYTYAAVWLRDGSAGTWRLAAGDGPGGRVATGTLPSPTALKAFNAMQPVHVGSGWSELDPDTSPRGGVRSQLAVPLVVKERVMGVVDLESRQANAYSRNDERLLVALANHAALVLDNLNLLQEARQIEALKELDRMKTEILGTVSHELRTPLGSIKGFVTTLMEHHERLAPEESREFLEIIDSEADRLRELIENLLDLSRLEAGVLRIDRSLVRLGDVAREVTRRVALSSPGHTVLCEWPEDPPVMADSRRVYQVIQNLLTNAVKYAPDGGEIRLTGEVARGQLMISVRDQGLGMPPWELDRIFDRFHRVGSVESKRIGGTGLGLAICKGLVEAHGGRIWAASEGEGKGSTFTFTLPLATTRASARSHVEEPNDDDQEIHRTRR